VLISIIWMLRESSTSTLPSPTVTMIEPGLDGSDGAFGPGSTPAPSGPTIDVPAVDPTIPASPDGAPPPDATATETTAPTETGAAVAPAESVAVAPAEPAAPTPVGTQLVLEFQEISWARVEDASGKSLLSGVISPGDTQTLDGKPPYSVFLGNALGVKVSFGGVPIDVKPFQKSNSTARFSVPAAGN
jgi:cytoskeleton protein RodZ